MKLQALQNEHGFSLVETLVATFIFALITAASVALLTGYQDGRISLKDADEKLAKLEMSRAILRRDFLAAVVRPVRDELGGVLQPFEAGEHMPDGMQLRLVRAGHMGAKIHGNLSQVKRIEYLFQDRKLIRRTYIRSDVTPGARFQDQVLLTDLEQVSFRLATDGIWSEEWGTIGRTSSLPQMAEIRLQFEGDRYATMAFIVGTGV